MTETFATTPRISGAPFDVRMGDDRLIRRNDGGVERHFGYYSAGQERARNAFAARLRRDIMHNSFFASLAGETKCR